MLSSLVLFCVQVFTVSMPISSGGGGGGGGAVIGSGGDSGYVGFILISL